MRSFILVISAAVLVFGGFIGYTAFQSRGGRHFIKKQNGESVAPAQPTNDASKTWNKVMPGTGVWVKSYDEKGQLKNQFRSDDYHPQSNGNIKVTNPVAEFFMPHNQMMRLIGKTGDITMPQQSAAAQNSSTEFISGSPERGEISDVTIELYNLLPDALPNIPDETITTRVIQFDNATRLITTESYKDPVTGVLVAHDQVPVHMRSDPDHRRADAGHRGYDFDGRGLRLRWNDKDGRLDLLEVAHGEQLIIKDASSASGTFGAGARGTKSQALGTLGIGSFAMFVPDSRLGGEASVFADPWTSAMTGAMAAPGTNATNAVAGGPIRSDVRPNIFTILDVAPPAAPKTTRPAGQAKKPPAPNTPAIPVPYVATFYEHVTITQGDEVLITSDRMDVDFISHQKQENEPTTAPATRPAGHGDAPANADVDPTTQPGETPATAPSTQSSATRPAPTTRPSAPPVVIRWTGKLVMLSAQPNRPKVAPGDAIVELTGEPVVVRRTPAGQQEGDDVRAARVIYHTTDGAVKLVNSKSQPQVVISKLINGTVDPKSAVTTSTLDYVTDPAGKKLAILTGPGHAMMPIETKQSKSAGDNPPASQPAAVAMMDTHWKSGAKVFFTGKGQGDLNVDHVDLAGDVDVKHPQLALQSQALSLYFEPPVKPTIRPARDLPAKDGGTDPSKGPSTRPAEDDKPQQELKRVLATEAVHCVLAGQNGKKQTIDSSVLDMHTARSDAGKFYARQVDASGAVHAYDGEQDLKANSIALTLKPAEVAEKKPATQPANITGGESAEVRQGQRMEIGQADPAKVSQTQPAKDESDTAAVELEKMVARDDVLVTNKDGSSATGALLVVTTEDHQNHVRLTGSPNAMVVDTKKNTVVGPVITFEQGVAHVLGAGKMHMLQEQADGTNPRPMDATWVDHADMNGPANRIDLIGAVNVTTHDADGTVNVATGDLIHIDLVDKPAPTTQPAGTTRPATRPVAAQAVSPNRTTAADSSAIHPATRPAETRFADGTSDRPAVALGPTTRPTTRPVHKDPAADSMQMGAMKDKDARTITIDGSAEVVSTLSGDNGEMLRQFALYAPKIIYQLADSKELPAKTLLVPSAGKLYTGDHRPPEKPKPGAATKPAKENGDDPGGRGDTAFQWSKQLIYSEAQRQATMTGDVLVVHQPLGKDAEADRVRINADKVIALFEPQKRNEKAVKAPPPGGTPGESMQLKHVIAEGHTVITRANGATLYAEKVDYDPITHLMTAYGNENNPARYVDPDPHRSMTGREMQWNTDTWNVHVTNTKTVNPR